MMFYGFDPTFIVLIPAILFTVYAQRKVQSAYATYSRVPTKRQIPGSQVARMILDNNGMGHVPIEMISGQLTDNYDPTKDELPNTWRMRFWQVRCAIELYNKRDSANIQSYSENGLSVSYLSGLISKTLLDELIPKAGVPR